MAGGVKTIRPSDELRLRKWPPGRASQLKIVVANLEQAINRGLAAQVKQTNKRRFSEFIPIIPFQDISGEVEFREIRVFFEPPKGLKNLLFYEYQIAQTAGFYSFREYNSPNPSFVFSGLEDNLEYFIRMRVCNNEGFVGPWSDTFSGTTPTAKALGQVDGSEINTPVSFESFVPIYSQSVTTVGGKVYYSIQYSVQPSSLPSPDEFEYSTVEFKFMENKRQIGQPFLVSNYAYGGATGVNLLSIYDGEQATAGDPLTADEAFKTRKRGTFVQKFHSVTAGDILIEVYARIANYHTLPNEFSFNAGTSTNSFVAASTVSLKNFTLFEVYTGA